jgi:hypothetical protein
MIYVSPHTYTSTTINKRHAEDIIVTAAANPENAQMAAYV